MGTLEKLQQTSDEIGEAPEILSIPILSSERTKIKQSNFVVKQTLLSGSNSFIFGHPINGRFGIATGLGGGQIVFGQSGSSIEIELIRRRYDWNTESELAKGKKSDNVDISQGFIQLGNVVIKNIYLEHKTK